jgi:uncharacterized RDD family membrane protein YckC
MIDVAIQLGVALAIVLFFVILAATLGSKVSALPKSVAATSGSVALAVFIFSAFLLFFGYFILFEWLWQGRTPGKRLVGIRVVRDGGFPVDFTGSAIRNLVRILEFGFGFYLLSAISSLLSPLNRRLGDYAAGTIVVRDARYERTAFGILRREEDPVMRDLDPAERELIRRYAERRDALIPAARTPLAAHIAQRIRPKLAAPFDHLDDDALLEHLAQIQTAGA